jgi:hypothetical protein
MKNWEVRRDETINFIRTATVTTNANRREMIADLLKARYSMDQAFSDSLSQGRNWDIFNVTGAKSLRKYRRACIAIRVGILGMAPAAATGGVANLDEPALRAALGIDLGLAYQQEIGLLNVALITLRNTPGIFMAYYPLKISASHGASLAMNSLFYYDFVSMEYRFAPAANLNHGELMIGPYRAPYVQIPVYNLDWRYYTAISNNMGGIMGDVVTGNIMITDQLTGCSFMYQQNGANMTAIHVQPHGANPYGRGFDLVITMRGQAGFANGPLGGGPLRILGARPAENRPLNYNPTQHQTQVLGVLVHGAWQIWVQSRNRWSQYHEIVGSWQL